ncbi:DUF6786 family protein [Membranihabitans marinus]|uniref:DUF6786 family protein n=1 Tax=Membranihabitans marinus TaxID=1227546 RepID=UPI001F42292F|nr:DUF6786 family protein [Membranihabitans marinus]
MKAELVIKAFEKAGRSIHLIGDLNFGVLVALDLEGRLYTIIDGVVINRVNEEAIFGKSTREKYINPGGDGLWPAPEGTSLGYHYNTGEWSVPVSVRNARYVVKHHSKYSANIIAELDLVNNQGLGLPTIFKRNISINKNGNIHIVKVEESITYVGVSSHSHDNCLIAPWTLSQFNSDVGNKVVFPGKNRELIWDMYAESGLKEIKFKDGLYHIDTDGLNRFQIGLGGEIAWIQFLDYSNNMRIRRIADPIAKDQDYIDISDVSPKIKPNSKGVRYSIYNDSTGFMELEAVGGCPKNIDSNIEIGVTVITEFEKIKKD